MRTPFFLISVFLLITLLFQSSLSRTEKCNPYDKKALLVIKNDFGNPYVFTQWDPKTDCCSEWYGVKCDQTTNRVISIYVNSPDSLSGQIPASVANLPTLEALTFSDQPNLTGPIQPAIAKIKNLNSLQITFTNMSGPVPDFLGDLKKLNYINLSFNNFSGTIPSSLSKLPELNYLRLDRNKLTGTIPETFGDFKAKEFSLFLSHNQLSGKIPITLGRVDFDRFDFSRNQLVGDASVLFESNRKTASEIRLDLSRNMLEFNLSKIVKLPMTMIYLDLNHNKIYGGIPKSWTSSGLRGLNVSYNTLCGEIPFGGALEAFDYSSYFHNKCLCDSPLPACKKKHD
jgi:hypothetical protein